MTAWILVFLATAVYDFCWVLYTIKVQNDNIVMASLWSGGIYAVGAGATIAYNKENTLLIPAIVGAIVGTAIGMLWNRWRKRQQTA